MKYVGIIILTASLLGCASTSSDEKNDRVAISYDENNTITSVVATPRRNLCLLTSECSWIGASWDARWPEEVSLLVHFRAGFDIRKTTLYIDEYPITLVNGKNVTQFDSHGGSYAGMRGSVESSTRAYQMPLEMFNRILSAKTVSISTEPTSRHKRHFFDKVSTKTKKGAGYLAIESLMKAINKA